MTEETPAHVPPGLAPSAPAPGKAASDPSRLPDITLEALQALVAAGQVEAACRLAGRACVALRFSDPKASHRFDVFLHRVTRKLDW